MFSKCTRSSVVLWTSICHRITERCNPLDISRSTLYSRQGQVEQVAHGYVHFSFVSREERVHQFWEMCCSSDTLTVIIFPFCHCFPLICTATCVTSWVGHDLPWVNPCCSFQSPLESGLCVPGNGFRENLLHSLPKD